MLYDHGDTCSCDASSLPAESMITYLLKFYWVLSAFQLDSSAINSEIICYIRFQWRSYWVPLWIPIWYLLEFLLGSYQVSSECRLKSYCRVHAELVSAPYQAPIAFLWFFGESLLKTCPLPVEILSKSYWILVGFILDCYWIPIGFWISS